MATKFNIGTIVSADLTVPQADLLKDFYTKVIGWQTEDLAMKDGNGTYADYVMKDSAGNWAGGVCHSRGVNQDLPPQWIVYVNVADIAQSMAQCLTLGGKVLKEARTAEGELQYALLQDPLGAILAVTRVPEE
ncbi:VOC family protein [Chitinophaga sp.]|uniref:VOC family protein n=1 Tax=Chitinophaga sp. TaxID=1869181 RepID=UPI0031DC91E8